MSKAYREKSATVALMATNLTLGVLIIFIGGVTIYFRYFYNPQFDPNAVQPYVAEARERLKQHSDLIATEAVSIVEEIDAPIADAVYEQVKSDYPRYLRTLKSEGKQYLGNVEQTFIAKVKSRYASYVRRHQDILKQEFPNHGSDKNIEAVIADFEHTFDQIVERHYLDEFHRQADRTVQLWEDVEPVPMPRPDQPSLNEQFADYMADWTLLALSNEAEERLTSSTGSAPVSDNPSDDSRTEKLEKEEEN